MDSKDLKKELAESQGYLNDYGEVNDIRLDIALAINKIRIKCGLTQKELAKKMKTKQTAISRAESGDYLPSLSFLERMAKALGAELIAPKFAFLKEPNNKNLNEEQKILIDEIAQISDTTFATIKLLHAYNKSSAHTNFDKIKLTS